MSGLYNMLFGQNPMAPILLKIAGLDQSEIPRYRDCFIKEGNIQVYTRTGGGNRRCYAEGNDHSECYHTANDALAAKPNYIRDWDDGYDSTYAYFEFKPLEKYRDLAEALGQENPDPGIGEKFKAVIEGLKAS